VSFLSSSSVPSALTIPSTTTGISFMNASLRLGLEMNSSGGITLVGWFLGWISVWAVVLAIAGIFTMINGLMGEEGVW
jgi:hypothetical protein